MPELSFEETGNGPVILLLHGFPMNKDVWKEFRTPLSKYFTVVTIDLPGFGGSPILPSLFSIEDVAEEVLEWLASKNINKFVVAGHSLGGYIALAMAKKNPEAIQGLCLFNSTAYPDSEEKKESRLKVIDFIKKNGVLAFTSNFIVQLFADQNHPDIEKVRAISMASLDDAVRGYTLAMRNRNDSFSILENFQNPILFLAGDRDNGISVQSILKQASVCRLPEVHVLEGVAHMGMFEAPTQSVKIISDFSTNCFR